MTLLYHTEDTIGEEQADAPSDMIEICSVKSSNGELLATIWAYQLTSLTAFCVEMAENHNLTWLPLNVWPKAITDALESISVGTSSYM